MRSCGTEFEVRATPQARNSAARDERPACCGSASCIPICPVQAKYDATVHLSSAEKNGTALHAQTTATMVEVGPDGHVTAIRFRRWDGSEGVASGKVFVLAAHAIETPRLLLNSRTEALPNGVANRSGQVGRNLMDHPVQLSWALAPAASVALPGTVIDLWHRDPSRWPIPQRPARLPHRDR